MARFDTLAERLPSVWRPDEDDVGQRLALLPAAVSAVIGPTGPLGATLTARGTGVLVSLPREQVIRAVRLASDAVAGTGYVLELRTLRAGQVPITPTVVAPVAGRVARPTAPYRATQFTVQLVRRRTTSVLLQAVADALDELSDESTVVLQAHWLATADHATTDPWQLRTQVLAGKPPLRAPDDLAAIQAFPYVNDLARLAGLLGIVPWEEPPTARETAEDLRLRVRRTVALYRLGLGTLGALARMTELSLPRLPGGADRRFTVIEHAPRTRQAQAATAGPPEGIVGALMRFAVTSDALEPTTPTLFVQGIAEVAGETDATQSPLLERLGEPDGALSLGLAFTETVAPGQTLRVRPTVTSWLGGPAGLLSATAAPDGDPTAAGPWASATGGDPPQRVSALCTTADLALWAGDPDGALVRLDAAGWATVADGLPPVRALATDGLALLVGTDAGLLVGELHPDAGGLLALDTTPRSAGPVNAVVVPRPGTWLLATGAGLFEAGPGQPPTAVGPVAADGAEPDVRCVLVDESGARWIGLARGLVVEQPGLGHTYAYRGGEPGDVVPEFRRLEPGAAGRPVLPDPAEVFLPTVLALARDSETALWLGTERGLARYRAARAQPAGFDYTTQLEAFPEATDGPVRALSRDPLGRLWIGCDRGLLSFDGRELVQHRPGGEQVSLGRPDDLGDQPRGPWRFNPASGAWERFSVAAGRRFLPAGTAPATAQDAAVDAVAWTAGAEAELLEGWDPATGGHGGATPVPPEQLQVRFKPSATAIVVGGIPAAPALPPGPSVWRYLRREPDAPAPPAREPPAWTSEGRLLTGGGAVPGTAPAEARFDVTVPGPEREWDRSVFGFLPSARVWLQWSGRDPLSVRVRLARTGPDEVIDPLVLDRVWDGLQRVRPAGVRVQLAVEETVVRGGAGDG